MMKLSDLRQPVTFIDREKKKAVTRIAEVHSPYDDTAKLLSDIATHDEPRMRPAHTTGGCPGCGELKLSAKQLASGAKGVAKMLSGRDKADPDTIQKRQQTCLSCPSGCYRFGVCDTDRGGCGCLLPIKTALKSESCPKGHW